MVYLLYCLKKKKKGAFRPTHGGSSDAERLRECVDIWDKDYGVIVNDGLLPLLWFVDFTCRFRQLVFLH